LAYLLLVPADRLWTAASLPARVWRLRLICGLLACASTAVLLFALSQRLGLPFRLEGPLVFIALSGQMFYATTAHITNDWLAAPLMVAFFERAVAVWRGPTWKNGLLFSLASVAGLLTKAYFLALVPLVLGIFVALAIKKRLRWWAAALFCALLLAGAGPWYARNLVLYRNLSGVQWTNGGTDWPALGAAFIHLPWLRAIKEMAFASLWTGNNSYRSFSSGTLSMLLGGFLAAAVVYAAGAARRRKLAGPEAILVWGFALYGVSLVYSATAAFWSSGGAARTATPWQIETAVPPLLALLFCGLARSEKIGRVIVSWLVLWSSYVIAATYWAKLIPLYTGYSEGRTVLVQLAAWYRNDFPAILAGPSQVMLAQPVLVFWLAALVTLGVIGIAIPLVILQFARDDAPSCSSGAGLRT
jgi:hypothetical protein